MGANDRIEKFYDNGGYLTPMGQCGERQRPIERNLRGLRWTPAGILFMWRTITMDGLRFSWNDTSIIPPFIEQQPVTNQLVAAGVNVTFNVGSHWRHAVFLPVELQ